jgi:putative membrane protein
VIKTLILNFLSLLVLSWLLPAVSFSGLPALGFTSLLLTLLNFTLKPVLKLLFLPMNIITLGIFGWVINGLVLALAFFIVPGTMVQPMTLMGVNLGTILSFVLLAFLVTIVQRIIDLAI